MKFHTLFNRPPRVLSPHGTRSMTDAAALADTDINTIVKRYNAGDRSMVRSTGVFADVSGIKDYQDCLERVRKADAAFLSLPSAVRDRFANDPAKLIAFLNDGKNRDEAIALGLIPRPAPVAPVVKDFKTDSVTPEGVEPEGVEPSTVGESIAPITT